MWKTLILSLFLIHPSTHLYIKTLLLFSGRLLESSISVCFRRKRETMYTREKCHRTNRYSDPIHTYTSQLRVTNLHVYHRTHKFNIEEEEFNTARWQFWNLKDKHTYCFAILSVLNRHFKQNVCSPWPPQHGLKNKATWAILAWFFWKVMKRCKSSKKWGWWHWQWWWRFSYEMVMMMFISIDEGSGMMATHILNRPLNTL